MASRECRVCVVGSGVAGSTVSQVLLDQGVRDIVMVDAGPAIKMRDPRKWQDYTLATRNPFRAAKPKRSDFKDSGIAMWLHESVLRARGGTTLH